MNISSLEDDVGVGGAIADLAQHLVSICPEGTPHIRNLLLNYLAEQRSDLIEEAIAHVIIPSRNEDAIIWLQDEIVWNVVDNDRLVDVTAQQRQVLDEEWAVLTRVLTVEAVLDIVADIDLVDNLVGVLLQGRCEDDDFIVSGHGLDELNTARSHQEEAIVLILDKHKNTSIRKDWKTKLNTYFNIVDESLVEI